MTVRSWARFTPEAKVHSRLRPLDDDESTPDSDSDSDTPLPLSHL